MKAKLMKVLAIAFFLVTGGHEPFFPLVGTEPELGLTNQALSQGYGRYYNYETCFYSGSCIITYNSNGSPVWGYCSEIGGGRCIPSPSGVGPCIMQSACG
jgi:hypothetical protein